jgi:hypothetical protein
MIDLFAPGFAIAVLIGGVVAAYYVINSHMDSVAARSDILHCTGGPPTDRTDLDQYRKRLAECERFYEESK